MSKGKLIYNIKDLYDRETGLMGKQGDYMFVPSLQSDYTLVIIDHYEDNVNTADYEPILIQEFNSTPFKNGFESSMDKLGFQSVDFKSQDKLAFTYIATPYVCEWGAYRGTYTSIIHYYYAKRFAANGTLRVKTKNWCLPACLFINMQTDNVVYVLKDCVFSNPVFTPSPSQNTIAKFSTSVTFSSYKDYLHDTYDSTKITNTQKVEEDLNGDGIKETLRNLKNM